MKAELSPIMDTREKNPFLQAAGNSTGYRREKIHERK